MNSGGANHRISPGARTHAVVLWVLTLLFSVRVLGQALQRWCPQSYLPAFGTFQGSGLPYPLLFLAQLVILAFMVRTALRVGAGSLYADPRKFRIWSGIGVVYMAGSILRILIGIGVPAAPAWFRAWIPASFHLVLAGFVITLALYIRRRLSYLAKA